MADNEYTDWETFEQFNLIYYPNSFAVDLDKVSDDFLECIRNNQKFEFDSNGIPFSINYVIDSQRSQIVFNFMHINQIEYLTFSKHVGFYTYMSYKINTIIKTMLWLDSVVLKRNTEWL